MTAKIIETNDTPFNRVDVDTVTVDIIENALKIKQSHLRSERGRNRSFAGN